MKSSGRSIAPSTQLTMAAGAVEATEAITGVALPKAATSRGSSIASMRKR